MSASPPKADIGCASWDVRFVPKADSCTAAKYRPPHGREGAPLVLPRVDKETENSFFTKCFGGFQPMQAFNEHEPSAVRAYQDRRLLALVELVAISSTRF